MKRTRSARPGLTSIVLALPALLLGACPRPSSEARSPDWFTQNEDTRRALAEVEQRFPLAEERRGQEELKHVQRFFESLPRCASQDLEAAVEIGRLPPSPGEGEVRVRGFLATTGGICTLRGCFSGAGGGDSPRCCQECFEWSWVVSAPGMAKENIVVLGGESLPSYHAGWKMMDCTMKELHDNTPLREVIVRGSMQRWEPSPTDLEQPGSWRMRVSQLCVLEPSSARLFHKDVTSASRHR